jgi:acetyl-CoA acyltransferase
MMGFNPLPNAELAKKTAAYLGMGDTAENVATVSDFACAAGSLAVASQDKAASAIAAGKLEAEIVPIPTKAGIVDKDGTPRPERLEALPASSLPLPRKEP